MLKRFAILASAVCSILSYASSASADAINLPASAGVWEGDCASFYIEGVIKTTNGNPCNVYVPIQLPVGKFIDGVSIGFYYDTLIYPPGIVYISGLVDANQYNTLGGLLPPPPLTVPNKYFLPTSKGQGFMTLHPASGPIPVLLATTYWVSVEMVGNNQLNDIQILYH